MREIFELKDKELIDELLATIEYGTLALCHDNKPYSVPVNFVHVNGVIYFHGAQKGRKIDILKSNPSVALSIAKDLSLIPSFFATDDGSACPATQFFMSVMIEGEAVILDDMDEKAFALESLMQKLQKEGGYKRITNNSMYEKMLKATSVVKINIETLSAKVKCAQHKSSEIQEKIIENLTSRATDKDKISLSLMEKFN